MRSIEDKAAQQHRTSLGKPTPSKWDDAQKWLIGLSRGGNQPRNSNADDTRLIASVPQKQKDYSSGDDDESIWRVNKPIIGNSKSVVRVRDMGTDMTPVASLEPSRTTTPIRSTTPVSRSPITSGSSTPVQRQQTHENRTESNNNLSPLEARAVAWDEAERAKYTARYKREEIKIQAWENHEKRKAEMEMKKMEVKAERLKSRTQEKLTNKLATTKRIAEEKLANAEAELNEKAVRTSERADYIRRNGHLPSSFKLPSLCW